MKKFIKYSLFAIIYLILIYIFAILFIVTSKAEIIKPNNGIEPYQVVKIQLRSLKNNNEPFKDAGIEQTWEFAHPNNQKYTGPLDRFKTMLRGNSFSMLLNHSEHQVSQIYTSENVATFEVIVLDIEKKYYKFKWQVERYKKEGPLKDCWLTTAVSPGELMGSSI
tara:strand:+ start:221 stop:715 length:495 start_codon:yes stop_codon:yes gene_type:complete